MINKRVIKEFLNRDLEDWHCVKELTELEVWEELDLELPADFGFKTSPWKHQAASFICGLHNKDFIFLLDMGLGKSLLVANILYLYALQGDLSGKTLILAPNEVGISEWEGQIEEHTDFTYTSLLGKKEEKWKLFDENDTDLYIISYDGLLSMLTALQKSKNKKDTTKKQQPVPKLVKKFTTAFQALILDELHLCFAPDTLITTKSAKKRIKDIKRGDIVYNKEGLAKVSDTFINRIRLDRVIRLAFSTGSVTYCDQDHLYFTNYGWVKAIDLGKKNLTLEPFLGIMESNKLRIGGGINDTKKSKKSGMRVLWRKVCSKITSYISILQHLMLSKMEESTPTYKGVKPITREDCKVGEESETIYEGESRKTCRDPEELLREDEKEQSHVYEGSDGESKNYQKNKRNLKCMALYSRGEWALLGTSTLAFFFSWLAYGGGNLVRKKTIWLSNQLQSGYRKCGTEARNRSGWSIPFYNKGKRVGQEENRQAGAVRLESIEIYKRGNNDQSFKSVIKDTERDQGFVEFYDLEIEGHPSYYANGLLVHNCKNMHTLAFRLCNAIAKNCDFRYGLTGTPFGRKPIDLWAQFFLIDRGETLGSTLGFFQECYFRKVGNGFGYSWEFDMAMEKKLHRAMRHKSIRYAEEELDSMPPKVYKTIKVPFSSEAYQYYELAHADLLESQGNYQMLKNSFVRKRQIVSGYVDFKDDEENRQRIVFKENLRLDALMDYVTRTKTSSKIVIFVEFTPSGDMIAERLTKAKIKFERLYSGTKDKIAAKNNFVNDPGCKILLANSKSGGVNLNLQVADHEVFYECPVSPIVRRQAEKRAPRGAKTKTTYIVDIMVKNSVDEDVMEFIREGKDLFQSLVEGKGGKR